MHIIYLINIIFVSDSGNESYPYRSTRVDKKVNGSYEEKTMTIEIAASSIPKIVQNCTAENNTQHQGRSYQGRGDQLQR